MLQRVESYIAKHRLLKSDGRYLVALSGGADSVALLLILQELGYMIESVHCNFRLRGDESDRDEQFVTALCEGRGIVLHRAHFDTKEYAALHHVSIEMAARELRYHYFEQLRQDLDMDGICVAHHRDDSVETVLMNMVRGTGIRGLQGIQPRNGYILRPLLCLSRKNIEDYLHNHHQEYVTDSTNLVDDVVRNKIRLNVIPILQDINPEACEHIQQTSEYVSEALQVYDQTIAAQRQEAVVSESDTRLVLDLSKVTSEPMLFEVLKPYGFPSSAIGYIAGAVGNSDALTGKLFESDGYDMVVDRGRIIVEQREEPMAPLVIPEEGNYMVNRANEPNKPNKANRPNMLSVSLFDRTKDFVPSKEPQFVHLDADKVTFPLTIRPIREADRFVPFGMTGHKLVSDYLTDRKVNLLDKRKSLVVCDATGDILWLVGYRTDNRFRVSEETTSVLQLSI